MSTDDKKTYLLTDFGDSCIRYIVVEDTKANTAITKIKTDNSTGAAPQVGNKANAYVIHSKVIIEKMKQIVELNNVSEIILNLPSYEDRVMVLPARFKEGNLLKYILKEYPEIEDDSIIIAGEIQTNAQGTTLVPISAIQKEYVTIIENASKLAKVKVTTSLTRVPLISRGLNESEEHVILDVGYSATRGMVLDENGVPLAIIQSSFCGRDVIDAMDIADYKEAINKFNILQDVTEEAKARINNGALLISKKIKSKAAPGCKVYIAGGLSTLAWKRALDKTHPVEKLTCKGIEARNKVLAVSVAPMIYAGLDGFEPLNIPTPASAEKECKGRESSVSEDEYFKQVSLHTENGFAKEAMDDRYEEDDDDAEVVAKPVQRKKLNKSFVSDTPTKRRRQQVEEIEDEEPDDYEVYEEEEEEEVVAVAKRQRINPKQKSKRPQKAKKRKDKNTSSSPLRIILPIIAVVAVISVICVISYRAYISYKTNGKNVEIQVANESRSLVDYVHMTTDAQQIMIANVQETVEGDRHFLDLELQNTTDDIVSRLITALEECDVEQIFSEANEDGTQTVILRICFK